MLAYRRSGDDGYFVFEADVTDNGDPILPEDATTEEPPEYKEGFSLSIRGRKWVYVEVPKPPEPTVDDIRPIKENELAVWEEGWLTQPFLYDGKVFENSTRFREMISHSVNAFERWGELPKLWLTADKEIVQDISEEWLDGLSKTAYDHHQDRLIEIIQKSAALAKAATVEELNAIDFPEPPTIEEVKNKVEEG